MEKREKNTKHRRKKLFLSLFLSMVLILSNLSAVPVYAESDDGIEVEHNHDTEDIHVHDDNTEDIYVHDHDAETDISDSLELYAVDDEISVEIEEIEDVTETDSEVETTAEETIKEFNIEENFAGESIELSESATQDTEAPVINITAENEKYHSQINANTYCVAPVVTVTDDTKLVLVEATITGSSTPIQGNIENDSKSAKIDLKGKTGSITIKAQDEAGNTTTETIYVSHYLGTRQTFDYDATCTEPAQEITTYVCATCGEAYQRSVKNKEGSQATGHIYGEAKQVTPCGSDQSVTIQVCTVCGYVQINGDADLENGEHQWVDKTVPATCTIDGYTYQECSKCEAVKDMTVMKATGHVFGAYEIKTPMNCATNTPGVRESKCQNAGCDVSMTLSIPVSHTWSGRVTLKEAGCEEDGYTGYKCTVCGTDRGEEYHLPIKALGHDYSDNHDCTTESVCSRCKKTIPGKENHNLVDYQSDGTSHWQKCANEGCAYETKHESHIRPETATDCTNAWVCTVCSVQIAADYTSHSWSTNYESDGTYHWKTCVHTGCAQTTDKVVHTATDDGNCTTALICSTCKTVVREAKTHNFSDKYTSVVGAHYRACQNEGCRQVTDRAEHTYTNYHDCTKEVKCNVCGYLVVYAAKEHKFSTSPYYSNEEGHFHKCQNGDCEVKDEVIPHSGGTATCVSQAVCDICHASYGALNPKNHVGTVIQNVKQATTTQDGYTGDEVCTGCNVVIKEGEVVPKLPQTCTHNWIEQKDDEKSWEQCTKCGAIRNEKKHTLVQKSDKTGHWQKCETCSYTTTVVPHTPNPKEIDTDCTTKLTCSDCGYVLVEAFNKHNFDENVWLYDEDSHWHVCQNSGCDQTSEKVKHNPEDNGDCTSAVVCKDCKHTLTAAVEQHDWSSVWNSDANGHYQSCQNPGCTQVNREDHKRVADDGICTTPVICEVCGYEMEAGAPAHDFSGAYEATETGHYQRCQNPGCKEVNAETPHSGGTATCKAQAVCQVCGASYGDIDLTNHSGGVEVLGYVEPTTKSDGYTGDTVCTGCGTVLTHGKVLNQLEEGHVHVFDQPVSDDISHWKECRCGARDGYAKHSFGDWESNNFRHWHICTECGKTVSENHVYGNNNECAVCGAKMQEHTHSYEWKNDENAHWQECMICGETINNAAHTYENGVCTVCGAILATPVISKVENVNGGVKITWDKVTGAEKYRVYYKIGSGSWTRFADTTATSYTWTEAKSGTTYTFTVRCINNDATSFTSDYDRIGKSITYIAAPIISSVSSVDGGVQISWGKVTGAEKYRVYYKIGDGSWTRFADTTATSYIWTEAKPGTTYTFTVRCINNDATSFTSSYDTTGKTFTYIATAPKLTSVSSVDGGVQINWEAVTGAEKYRVYYKIADGSWTRFADTTATSYIWTEAKPGTTYTFTVRCINNDATSFTSSYDTVGKTLTYIAAAPKLTSVSNVDGGVQINWEAVKGAEKYRVYYKIGDGSWTRFADTTATSYIWTEAKPGTTYTFTVRCINSDATSFTSGYDTIGKTITYIAAAPKLTSVSNVDGGVQISWEAVTGAEKYRVYYKIGDGSWTRIMDTTATSYTWSGAKSGTTYTFTVRCINNDATSFTSSYDTVGKSITYVAAPKISSVSNVSNGVQINWGAVTGAEKYRVYYKIGSGSWTRIMDTTATSYTWSGAKPGTTYTFTVRCINNDATSFMSGYDATGKSITYR